jgi:hypothetical protein
VPVKKPLKAGISAIKNAMERENILIGLIEVLKIKTWIRSAITKVW